MTEANLGIYSMLRPRKSAFDYFVQGQEAKQNYETNQQMMAARQQAMDQAEQMNPLLLEAQRAGIAGTEATTAYNQFQTDRGKQLLGGELEQQDLEATNTQGIIDARFSGEQRADEMLPHKINESKAATAASRASTRASNMAMNNTTEDRAAAADLTKWKEVGALSGAIMNSGPEGSEERSNLVRSLSPVIKDLLPPEEFERIMKDGVSDAELNEVYSIAKSKTGSESSKKALQFSNVPNPDNPNETIYAQATENGVYYPTDPKGNYIKVPETAADKKLANEMIEADRARTRSRMNSIQQADNVMGNVKSALGFIEDGSATGITGALSQWVPGTNSQKLRNAIKSIDANMFSKALTELRAASITGAGVGNSTDKEGDKLQSMINSLDPNVGDERIIEQLMNIDGQFRLVRGLATGEITVVEKEQDFNKLPEGAIFYDMLSGEKRIKRVSKQ